ncbi:MAG: DUF2156 domain-containing protein [Spirochaetales bacterium]|nr:DUF2156 domain-containing protein [Spirochaetales bacterium]
MKDLDLEHKHLLEERLFNIETFLSEYCFSNLFLFRKKHKYKVGLIDDCVFISGESYDGETFIMPCCNINEMADYYFENFIKISEEFDMIFPIPEGWLPRFDHNLWRSEACEDDMDYIYTREKLWQYPGRKLHGKRNLFKQFNELYESQIREIDSTNIEDAKSVLRKWQKDLGEEKSETDYCPCREGLENLDILNLKGYIVYVDERAVGFTLGEVLSESVFGLHFAKGDKDIKGIYQYLFSKTAEFMESKIEYMNLEQDLGIAGLRGTKLSYQPDFMAKKYRLYRK